MSNNLTDKAKKRRLFGLADIFIIIVVAIVSVLSLVLQFVGDDSLCAVVRINGVQQYTVYLDDIQDEYDMVFGGDIQVTVRFSQSGVRVVSSDCPDKLCVHSGVISSSGQSVVCLPAKVTVTLISDSHNTPDAVVG